MRRPPSARLLVLDRRDRVLLFRFAFTTGALAGQTYWGTPGGALEDDESFEDGARRELAEETGIEVDEVGASIARLEFVLPMPDGETVWAEEVYFLVRCAANSISRDGWTDLERAVMTEHRWWSIGDLSLSKETIFPEGLVEMLRGAGVTARG
jgi:8-oxo-dGTP diphosphatase